LTIAIADPSDLATIDSLTHLLHTEIVLQVASEPVSSGTGQVLRGRGDSVVITDPGKSPR